MYHTYLLRLLGKVQWDHTPQVAGDKTKNSPVSVEIIQNTSVVSHEAKTRLILRSSVI